jgi:hypothetical protein
MALFITVSRGPRADKTCPVLVTGDRHVVGDVLETLARLDEWEGGDGVVGFPSVGSESGIPLPTADLPQRFGGYGDGPDG